MIWWNLKINLILWLVLCDILSGIIKVIRIKTEILIKNRLQGNQLGIEHVWVL